MGAKNKGIYKIFRTKEELEFHDSNMRHLTRIFTLDHVVLALGRMGFREKKFKEFNETLSQVYDEYIPDYNDDVKVDKDMEYSKDLLDRELKQYTGSLFVPYEQRYGMENYR